MTSRMDCYRPYSLERRHCPAYVSVVLVFDQMNKYLTTRGGGGSFWSKIDQSARAYDVRLPCWVESEKVAGFGLSVIGHSWERCSMERGPWAASFRGSSTSSVPNSTKLQ